MNRALGVVIVLIGVVLLVYGITSTNTYQEKFVEEVTGRYTESTMWYIIVGSAMVIAGGALFFTRISRK